MNANSTRNVIVESGGTQVVGHVGLHALGMFADRLGVGEALSRAVGWAGSGVPVHDRGKVLTQAMLMLAGGGESCTDIEMLASGERLFTDVCSDTTLYRTFTETLNGTAVDRARQAMSEVRSSVWDRIGAVNDGPVILDLDASLVEIHSENKQGAAAHFKGGYGFHPVFCFADATGEALGGQLRPGNAAANDVADLLGVLDDAVSQLPVTIQAGHQPGDDPDVVQRTVVVRSDSAGGTKAFVDGCRSRNIGFQVVSRRQTAVSAAIATANEDPHRWETALDQDGSQDDTVTSSGLTSSVCEVTDLVELAGWPEGTRLIIRRQPLHPGVRTSLLPDLEYRFWGHYTDQEGDPVELDRSMRAHAHVEDFIGRLKDSGLERFPFTGFEANQAWLQTVMWAADLVTWFQLLCLTGELVRAKPKRLRWTLWHTPARVISTARRDVVRILDTWPTATDLLGAYRNIAALT
ncbi:MAG: IS1380 family transposase [Actinomycetota bacterium]|nr:IS1380 family transposase [Actinomycetota bacterium]